MILHNMELLEENASALSDSPLLYVHCLDFNSQSYIGSSNLACCRFLTVLGHFSFPKELRERRLCLFVNTEKLKDLSNKTSPAVVKVKSSCIHKLENESDEDQGRQVLIVFDFDVMLNQTRIAATLPPYDDYDEENNMKEMPWLDITLSDCNCSRFPNVANIAVGNGLGFAPSESESVSSDSGSDLCDSYSSEHNLSEIEEDYTSAPSGTEETCYTEYFKLKGSTYHDHFQNSLRKCKRLLLDQEEVPVQLVIEPMNKEDENAIIVQAELENVWNPVGYIPGAKVKKAMDALDKQEIKTIKFKTIEWKFIYGLSEFKYVSSIVVTKLNKWLPSDKDYQYNDILQ